MLLSANLVKKPESRLRVRPVAAALLAAGFSVLLAGCQQAEESSVASTPAAPDVAAAPPAVAPEPAVDLLDVVLMAQPQDVQARFDQRNPRETLGFFGIEPGMTVLEALPGGGWYTKILVPYLGIDGTLIGVDYDKALFPLFGFFTDEQLTAKETWADDWRAEATAWFGTPVADIDAFQFGSVPARISGEVDAVLFIRALHNLARFEGDGGFLTSALEDTIAVLKPGGVVGVVQHMAPEDAPDAWADGSAGYLKKSFVIAAMEAAGLELVGESSINENPADQPTTDDIVWRLPPTMATSADNPELAETYKSIGESNRMTLLFRKAQ